MRKLLGPHPFNSNKIVPTSSNIRSSLILTTNMSFIKQAYLHFSQIRNILELTHNYHHIVPQVMFYTTESPKSNFITTVGVPSGLAYRFVWRYDRIWFSFLDVRTLGATIPHQWDEATWNNKNTFFHIRRANSENHNIQYSLKGDIEKL